MSSRNDKGDERKRGRWGCRSQKRRKKVPFKMMVYVEEKATYMPVDEVPEGMRTLSISGTELRQRLAEGRDIPSWFSYPEVAEELRRSHPPRHRQGLFWCDGRQRADLQHRE
jgi:ATP sulfurylase